MNIASIISGKYDNLINTVMRPLFRNCIVEDFQTETIKIKETIEKTCNSLKDPKIKEQLDNCRPLARSFLNEIYFSIEELGFDFRNATLDDNNAKFWFEFAYRLKKLVIVLIILERENLKGFGCKPEMTDCPQCLVDLSCFIEKYYKENGRFRIEYKAKLSKLKKDNPVRFYWEGEDFFVKK
jgi:hypothetical protein